MEDIKDTLKKLEEEKKKQEKTERLIILLIGIFVALIFAVIGINIYYTSSDNTVSEPKVVIEDNNELKNNTVEKVIPRNDLNQDNTTKQIDNEVQKTDNAKEKTNVLNQGKEKTSSIKIEKNISKNKVADKTPPQQNKAKQNVKQEKLTKSTNFKQKIAKNKIATKPKLVYTVQVGAFSSKERAKRYLKSIGKPGMIIEEGKIYRVVIGKFKTYKDAAQYMKKYKLKGFIRKIKIN